ncbi:MAG: FliA/WhiG family RNA polymerase sigma factor [Deltaproteobacteria bacterium]|nr:FliA/WhiG family RNA polymerase sigma factor [Deltaproteobacteria bacterium]MBW1960821.1 FliA/WhiG family RNA polymerase sigma factor [Deltaproteobacteria bacterium]MBW1993416.1 FliA/WhiG family RNA polymerase sigma factor [Deltaproteobacteria bacterium]MBW2153630.1 FliA/WhiG family RNA polymerase sigma factor [Deltaproteobacteria bacterium]
MARRAAKKAAQRRCKSFSRKQREAMIVSYAPLVKHIAGRMAMRIPSSITFDELISAGCLGLIDAIDRYDPSREVDLKTYAAYRIKGAILDELRNMDWYSRSMRKKIQEIERALISVEARKGRPAEDCEVAEEIGLSLEDYYKLLSNIHGIGLFSLDEYIKDEDNDSLSKKSFQERILSDDDPVENVVKGELRQHLIAAIKTLSEKEQMVISLYYFDDLTLKEIGHVMNLTESRICQIHTLALIRLRSKLKSYHHQ